MPSTLIPLDEHRKRQDSFLQQFGPDYRADLDLIFANPDGTPLKPNSISSSVSLLFRKLKLPKGTSLHSLRHTHGSFWMLACRCRSYRPAWAIHQSVTADIYSHAITGLGWKTVWGPGDLDGSYLVHFRGPDGRVHDFFYPTEELRAGAT